MKKMILILGLVIMFFWLNAQPASPGFGPVGNDPPVGDPPVAVPIDFGAIALLLAGVAYGAKKLKDKKK